VIASAKLKNLEARHRALRGLRDFFDERGFIEVETPTLVRSPGTELHIEALEVVGAGERRYLHPSPEYAMKRLLAAGMTRIFQVCKAYRRGELGHLHQPEFSMLEWYRSEAGSEAMIADTEALVARLAELLCGEARIGGQHGPIDLSPPWPRLGVQQAFERFAGTGAADFAALLDDEERFYRVLLEHVEPRLGVGRPTVLERYPAQMASLARLRSDDPSVADRFEVYVDGIELCNGFGELTDAAEQRRRLLAEQATRRQNGQPDYPIDERFLSALEAGMPESGGNALGLDRLLMLLLGTRDIAEVLSFDDAAI